MRMTRFLSVLCIVLVAVFAVAEDPIPISDVHQNDDMGFASMLDEIVTIQGVVTVPTGVFNSSRTEVYIQDETGGMALFSYHPVATYNLGDEVKVTGTVIQYKGLTEVQPITVELIATDQPVPEPVLLTCAQLRDSYDFATNTEPNESRLVRLNNVTWDPGNYALRDDTGTAMMYIQSATGIPYPEGEFNVVGVVKQFDDAGEEGPFYLNYEVLPRYVSDITYGSGPQFTEYPKQTAVAAGGGTISWKTDLPCETILEYGTTDGFEADPIRLGDSTTDHEVVMTGLASATVYYCRAVATDGANTVTSPEITIVAPAENSSGNIDVYFSQSVDTTYSTGVDAAKTNIADRMIERINAATASIDFCFYSFTRDDVAGALVAAHDRGVDVRVIYEIFDPVINTLIVAGIEVRTDPDEEHENTHNKFAVFDARDADETNDYVWTGSWNASYNATDSNAENAVAIQDAALAKAYSIEFDEMWGGEFGNHKDDNTPHMFLIGGRYVEQYMSPSDGLADVMTRIIGNSETDLLFAIYAFTDTVISDAIADRFNAGTAVRGVFDAEAAEYDSSRYQPLTDLGIDSVLDNVGGGGEDQLLHHKYLLADPLPGESDPTVVTGSYNWTYTAKTYKDENIVVIHDATIANIFFQEWMARYHEGGGEWDYEVPEFLEAAFAWTPESPVAGEEVTFTDASTGGPTGWNWDFGDGTGTSTEQNPVYTFAEAGTYIVTLEVTDGTDTSTVSHEVTVAPATVACTPIWIAAAAAAPGANDSVWATDLGINNSGEEPLTYKFQFLPRGANNTDAEYTDEFTVQPDTNANFVNIWNLYAGEGAGTINVCVSDPDAAGVFSRTYNTSDVGTFGQAIVGMKDTIGAGERVRLGFISENDGFRSNIGFANTSDVAITINVEFFSADGTSLGTDGVTIPPYSSDQWNHAFTRVTGDAVDLGYADVWTITDDGSFLTYASVVDNATSDPTTVWPFDPSIMLGDSGFDCTPIWIAAAASAAGAEGTQWATDLGMNNLGDTELSYRFQFLPRDGDNSDVAMSDPFILGAGQSVVYRDIWGEMTGAAGAGAINVCVDNGDIAGVISRTYNTGDNGTFGQTIIGMRGAAPAKIATGEKVRLGYLFENDSYRTNIGFANAGGNEITVNVNFYNMQGEYLGFKSVILEPFSNTQLNHPYTSFGGDVAAGFVDIWSDTENADFLTYASIVDNGTGDPTTVWPF